ncbi:Agamous-like MADS-box protein AGL92 [Labeo rohita]|uniref:Agamous-like MADS-box protein AGL92 n=1 Tax=Labeo rohita TaxID=84645 RepID=A0ABQ8LJ43_LABRO|nr:Agamous-like MADS-box protein AGL92 [Labeo rohita]
MNMASLQNVQPKRACWMHSLSSDQIKMINNALNEKESRQQFLAQVGATILDRSDFITLGHPNDVEGTVSIITSTIMLLFFDERILNLVSLKLLQILNACLSVVRDIADLKNPFVCSEKVCISDLLYAIQLTNIKVHCFSSYVTVTWLPPLCACPSANLPVNVTSSCCLPGH